VLASTNFRLCLAVAQWIEQRFDSAAGCGFESRQPDHTLEAPGISHLGLLCFSIPKEKTPPLLTGFFAVANGEEHFIDYGGEITANLCLIQRAPVGDL